MVTIVTNVVADGVLVRVDKILKQIDPKAWEREVVVKYNYTI